MARTPREEFLAAMLLVLPAKPGIAVVHSSLPDLLPPADFSAWDALYALDVLVRQGWTIVLPAFTFSFCGGHSFSTKGSPSEVGILADHLLEHFPQAVRTRHPIYSFAVLGPRATEIMACPASTTFGDDSPFALFEREQATVVMLGCSWAFNTQFHRYEEMAVVPYRYAKVFSGTADFGAGLLPAQATMWVRDLVAKPINDFSPAVSRLRGDGLIASATLWRGKVEAVAAQDIARVCRSDLEGNPYAYVVNGLQVARILSQQAEAKGQPPLRIAVLGSFNLHMLEQAWQVELAELLPERRLETYTLPFGQMRQALVDPSSELRAFAPNIQVFCDRLEDVAGDDWQAVEQVTERVREYAEQIAAFHHAVGGWSVVHRFAVVGPAADGDTLRTNAAMVSGMNEMLDKVLAHQPQIVWVDVAAEAAAHDGPISDHRLWYIGRFAFADGFSRRLARRWAGLTLAMLGKTARVVVLDLDNTLWGGVLGEDGLAGVKIGGDYPGNAFAAFQRVLKVLPQRGVALAVSSKNDEDLALRAMDELPPMVLRSADISARRINWQPKWQNIREIAAELNLGLESVLFVDDNPVEREAVRRNLPGVKVIDLPPDPALYADAVLNSPYLAAVAVTAEDRKRVDDFKARKVRDVELAQATSLEDYYASLNMTLHLSPLNVGNAQRAAQLCQKTNQFNTTTYRYALSDLEKMVEDGADVVVVGLEDRHSPLENVGLIVLKPDGGTAGIIDLYLLSCRVLGRGIETAVPRWAINRAAQRGWSGLRGKVIETERNTPVRKVYADAGFSAADTGLWTVPTQSQPSLPAWLRIIDHVSHR